MRDLKFEEVWFEFPDFDSEALSTDSLKPVADIFRDHVHRVHSLISFNVTIIGIAMRYQKAAGLAREHFETHGVSATDFEIAEKQREIVNDFEQQDMDDKNHLHLFQSCSADMMITIFRRYGFTDSIESTLFFMLQSAWTGIEVMLADLWEAALNESPIGLAQFSTPVQNPKTSQKVLNLNIVERYLARNDFNLSKVMGTLHRETERFNFTTLSGTIKAYETAFQKNGSDVQAAIRDQSLESLAQIRHTLVHRAGRADSKFLRIAGNIAGLSKWKNLTEGDKLEITGADVRNLLLPAFSTAFKLISVVDHWISTHQAKSSIKAPQPEP